MDIKCVVFNPFRENTYLVWDETKECIVVDAGNMNDGENRILQDMIEARGLKPVMAVNTHGHFDHVGGVKWLKDTYGAQFACSKKDAFLIESTSGGMMYGLKCNEVPPIDLDLDAMEELRFGSTVLKVLKTPGHTPGHVVLYNEEQKMLFTGDTLFRESIGRTDLPGGDYSWIMKSILEQIVPLGDDVTIYPGHEHESTIGHEVLYNPFIVEVLNDEVNYKG
ncbi:MAG: MBL fold metallo-hydrolase [Alistipes sp.]|uniref:MBL fold metallo-hydrolase n=1 Tax=Alistipes sp. TaxID=1872444 RepID=UPI001B521FFD|nr:MBL fold metallo-hydrolase [Alistipes sp.]